MANHLIGQKSPYLLQHLENPVDWYPWGADAFATAERLDLPIFLSIGYSSCHWCHVMAHESFEDSGIAEILNKGFICIKVDREERPDVDGLYMAASQMMTGSGGWPLNIFLTPQREPFYAATYIPRESGLGQLGLKELLTRLTSLWEKERGKVEEAAVNVVQALRESGRSEGAVEPTLALMEQAYGELSRAFDHELGGFGVSPKFPVPHNLAFLLRWWKRTGDEAALMMVEKTLQAMRRGGIFDQIGFGFHRYSTDREWVVPHFEKMLYDQALIVLVCLEAYQATRDPQYAGIAEETMDYMLRDLGSAEGGFFSGEDADSENEEGRFYLWNLEEVELLLGPEDGALAAKVFGILPGGNFQPWIEHSGVGLNILSLSLPLPQIAAQVGIDPPELLARLDAIRNKLYEARRIRVHPQPDAKILSDWNGLALATLARASQVLGNEAYLRRARRLSDFLLRSMRAAHGQLYHSFYEGEATIAGNLDDYAFVVWGLLEMYETSFETHYLKTALEITEVMISRFWDNEAGGFFFTAADGEKLLVRQKVVYDGALPSGNSVAMMNLVRLSRMTASPELEEMAIRLARAFSGSVLTSPAMHTHFLCGLSFLLGPSREIVIVGEADSQPTREMLGAVRELFIPDKVLLFKDTGMQAAHLDSLAPFTKDMVASPGKAVAYVCEANRCLAPVEGREMLIELLKDVPVSKPDLPG